MLRCRDGTRLSLRVYRPATGEPVPTILMLTCYMSSAVHKRSQEFNALGWAVVSVDCRGRGDSEGNFGDDEGGSAMTGPQSGEDGADAIGWIRAQPWSNGEVALRGGSMLGGVQWQIIAQRPAGLVAAAPFAAAKAGWDSDRRGNILWLPEVLWLAHTSGRTANEEVYDDRDWFNQMLRTAYREHWPLQRLAGIYGANSGVAERMAPVLAHASFDAYWQAHDVHQQQYAAIDGPILSVTGYYDGNQQGTLYRYRAHMQHACAAGRANHFLLLGPWDHSGVMVETQQAYGIDFGSASVVPRVALHEAFFNWARGCGGRPAFLKDRVGWYVTGANRWRWASRLEDIGRERFALYLQSDGTANQVDGGGRLLRSPPADGRDGDLLRCDPLNVRAADEDVFDDPEVLISRSYGMPRRADDGLVYTSEPFAEDIELAGFPSLILRLQSDAPDFDLLLTLWEVAADSAVFMLTEAVWRARWRASLSEESLMPIGVPEDVRVDAFGFFAHRLQGGRRLRLAIRSLDSIEWQRNYNGGGVVVSEGPAQARIAAVTVLPGLSRLEMPLCPRP